MRRVLATVAVLGLLAACGDGTKKLTAGDEVAQPLCVDDRSDGYDYTSDASDVSGQQSKLRKDVEAMRRYGQDHADEFTQVGFDNLPTVRTVAYFSGHVEEHRAALEKLVEHPDKLDVRQSLQSDKEQRAIMDSLDFDSGHFTGAGPDWKGFVAIQVHATAEARRVAQQLHDRHGDLVCITVAGHPFPKGAWPDTAMCPDEPARTDRNPSVEFKLILDKTTLRRGELGTGTARVKNNGTTTITVSTGTDIGARVTRPGSDEIVGGRISQFHDLAGRSVHAEPGQTAEIPVRFGTEDCAPNSDYSLPPGEYVVSSYLEGFGRSDDVTITIIE